MTAKIGEARVLPKEIQKVITELAGKTSPMSTLRTVVSALGHYEKNVPFPLQELQVLENPFAKLEDIHLPVHILQSKQ